MKDYSEDDIVNLSDRLNRLLTDYRFDSIMLNMVGRLLEAVIYYIESSN